MYDRNVTFPPELPSMLTAYRFDSTMHDVRQTMGAFGVGDEKVTRRVSQSSPSGRNNVSDEWAGRRRGEVPHAATKCNKTAFKAGGKIGDVGLQ